MAGGSIDGLVSGLNTSTIISQLMQVERQPQLRLQSQRDQAKSVLSIYQTLNSRFDALKAAALNLSKAADWQAMKATSSADDAVTVTAGSSAPAGSLTFSVQQLARAGAVASTATVASTAAVVSDGSFLISKGADLLGFASLGAGDGLAAGTYTVEVTADGKVRIDDGPEIDVSGSGAGPVALAGPNGTIMARFSGPLVAGKTTVTNVATGDGSLAAVVDGVNRAKAGVTAAAVQVGPDAFRLQLTSTITGAGSNITSGAEHLGALGSLSQVQVGQDAVIRIGDGPGAYDVRSASNTVSNVLSGVTLQLRKADPNLTVTIDVGRDAGALADKVKAMVDAANSSLSYIKSNSGYDPTSKKAGALLGDGLGRRLAQQVVSAVSNLVAGSTLGSGGRVGLSINRDGTIAFDPAKFAAAYDEDPEAVVALFSQVGSATDGSVSFVFAGPRTQAGTYAVAITHEAAAATGKAFAGNGLAGAETIQVRVGGESGTTVTYEAAEGESLADVASGLHGALSAAGLGLSATVEDGKLVVRSSIVGPSTVFEVQASAMGEGYTNLGTTAGAWRSSTGGVAGTIGGQPATYSSGVLTSAASTGPTVGLAVRVSITDPGDYGTLTYTPGIAQRLNSVGANAVDFVSGSIKTAIAGRESLIQNLDTRISGWDSRLALRETALRRQFSGLEVALGKLREQSNWLAGQLASLPTSSNNS